MSDFINKRRQSFLTESYYTAQCVRREKLFQAYANEMSLPDTDDEDRSLITLSWADDVYALFSLRYTAGVPCEELRDELGNVVAAYEQHQKAKAVHEEDPDAVPFYLGEVFEYERLLQLIGLAYLLHRRDLLPRIAKLVDAKFYGVDVAYEELLDYGLAERYDTDEISFYEPYNDLVQAMYADTDEESIADLQKYLLAWYPAMRNAGWHDTHLEMSDTEGAYFGYWAFEAGAVAYLRKLDDSEITHMVYPKDLVAWCRANKHLEKSAHEPDTGLRVPGGEACPRTGWWHTLAAQASRRYFKQGDTMPKIEGSDYGDTYWLWDADQGSPKL